jgi:hypothetical protein
MAQIWIILVIIAVLVLAAGLAVYALRHEAAPPPDVPAADGGDQAAWQERHDLLDARGQELLDRRIELDAIRGPLMGNTEVYDAFIKLEERLRSGEIDEAEFEREKVRLLGGS